MPDFGLVVQESGRLSFFNATGAPSPELPPSLPALPLGVWCRLALVLSAEGKSVSVFKDGQLLALAFSAHVQKLTHNLCRVSEQSRHTGRQAGSQAGPHSPGGWVVSVVVVSVVVGVAVAVGGRAAAGR